MKTPRFHTGQPAKIKSIYLNPQGYLRPARLGLTDVP